MAVGRTNGQSSRWRDVGGASAIRLQQIVTIPAQSVVPLLAVMARNHGGSSFPRARNLQGNKNSILGGSFDELEKCPANPASQ